MAGPRLAGDLAGPTPAASAGKGPVGQARTDIVMSKQVIQNEYPGLRRSRMLPERLTDVEIDGAVRQVYIKLEW